MKLAFEAILKYDMAGWCISRKHKQTVNSCVWVCMRVECRFIGNTWLQTYACVWADLSWRDSCIWQRLCLRPDVCPLECFSCGITLEKSHPNASLYTEWHKLTSRSWLHNRHLQLLFHAAQSSLRFLLNKCLSDYRTCFVLNIMSLFSHFSL